MRLPGFTAEASLYRHDPRFSAETSTDASRAGLVTPQQEDRRRGTWIRCFMQRHMGRTFFCCVNNYTGEYECSDISTF